jgi:type VI secretion system protein ImpK
MKQTIDQLNLRTSPAPRPAPPAENGLVEYFLELFTYTLYFARHAGTRPATQADLQSQFRRLIDRAEQARLADGILDAPYQASLYAVCAWVDEIVLCSDWPEKDKWQLAQLQRAYFNTTLAGEGFFDQLDRLPADSLEVREVYDYCLALGFKGRYFLPADQSRLDEIRRTNLRLVAETADLPLPDELFPEARPAAPPKRKAVRFPLAFICYGLLCAAPVIIFIALYVLYDKLLNNLILNYFRNAF